jgi:hypothetical protein
MTSLDYAAFVTSGLAVLIVRRRHRPRGRRNSLLSETPRRLDA